ncbi:dnaJ homolog subfamily C member 24 [Echeneis naucrates]|uniref:DnaJ (Hsp40) homolog, subfamily C, member 24 n=1 Tax=Echeneis naucrates TaxID=173247 RepID=A0A665UY62_ECHNA|nr:dnaJ homolog subfamily C member 24 [Echeneis naucrates]
MCEAEKEDLYAVLGANPSDSVQQLRHRYQQLALQYHPDRSSECSTEKASCLKKFLEVDAAWKILSDQNSRRQYDLQIRAQELNQEWPVDSTVYLEDMTWDQDECVYSYHCRCGGRFSISDEEMQEKHHDGEEEEMVEGRHRGVVICCDSCSLCVFLTWSLHQKT